MRCWKEAESKIGKVPHSQAHNVLLNYVAVIETMGLPISKKSVDLMVRLVINQASDAEKWIRIASISSHTESDIFVSSRQNFPMM